MKIKLIALNRILDGGIFRGAFGHEKLEGDSDGTKLLKKVRKFLLGIAE